jgi:hypothetical protein
LAGVVEVGVVELDAVLVMQRLQGTCVHMVRVGVSAS